LIFSMLTIMLLTAGLCLALIPLARKIGLVDFPGGRKVHQEVTPLTGGPSLAVSFFLIMLVMVSGEPFLQALAMGGLLMFLVGLIDDLRRLSALTRFVVQIAACGVMVVWANIHLQDFGQLFTSHTLELGPLEVLITVFAALGVINAFNMIDGMDGLAGSIFLVAIAGMALLAGLALQQKTFLILLMCFAAVMGFMLLNARFPWNRKARVFLGDSGSMLLGFILAWSFIALGSDVNEGGARAFMPMTAVWLIAVPLLDTSTQIWRRWRAGRPVLKADQYHLHHAFLRAGFGVRGTWLSITLLALALAVFGIGFELAELPDYLSFWTFMAFAFTYHYYMKQSWYLQRFLGRDFIYNEFDEPS